MPEIEEVQREFTPLQTADWSDDMLYAINDPLVRAFFDKLENMVDHETARSWLCNAIELSEPDFYVGVDYTCISSAFIWTRSPEGAEFWSNLHCRVGAVHRRDLEEGGVPYA